MSLSSDNLKRLLALIGLSVLALSAPVCFKRATQGFKLAKLRLEMPMRSGWERVSALSQDEIKAALGQSFCYLGKGSQCYAFESADQKYVLKLFRFDQRKAILRNKVERFFSAVLLAFDQAREETGLLYIHLNLTEGELPLLHAKGPIGQPLTLRLDRYRFALQKKVEPFRTSLVHAAQSCDPQQMAVRIDSFLSLLERRVGKGIGNSDSNLSRNFGFVGEEAIELDFGNYYLYRGSKMKEIRRYSDRLRSWLSKQAPDWVSYLDERVDQCDKRLSSS